MKSVAKPHLRNIFFRASFLLRYGVKCIFVLDGSPPLLKADELQQRRDRLHHHRGKGGKGGKGAAAASASQPNQHLSQASDPSSTAPVVTRRRRKPNTQFNRWCDESVQLVQLMGFPVLRANKGPFKNQEERCFAHESPSPLSDSFSLSMTLFHF